jgi:hypothetical protein
VFAVRVVICGNVAGNVSDEAQGIFKGKCGYDLKLKWMPGVIILF